MVLKTFNVEADVYDKFSSFCKGNGISMSKQIDFFMRSIVEKEPKARKEYLQKIENIRKGKFFRIKSIADEFA